MTPAAKAPAKANGTEPAALEPHDGLPVDSFRDAIRHLRRPFTAAAVKFKVQATWPKGDPTGGLIVSYIDQRLASERLNLVCPHLWHDAYEPTRTGLMWCHLTVDGITRSDVGEGQAKGLVSDALKRAAVKFGVGVSLYAVPKMMFSAADGTLKQKQTRDGLTLVLTPKGEQEARAAYTTWLAEHGVHAFGDPLDHGDVEGAQGDTEGDDASPVPEGVPQSDVPGDPAEFAVERDVIPAAEAQELTEMAEGLVKAGLWTKQQLKAHLVTWEATTTASFGEAFASLSPAGASAARAAMLALAETGVET